VLVVTVKLDDRITYATDKAFLNKQTRNPRITVPEIPSLRLELLGLPMSSGVELVPAARWSRHTFGPVSLEATLFIEFVTNPKNTILK
jgi:hypothetical protein